MLVPNKGASELELVPDNRCCWNEVGAEKLALHGRHNVYSEFTAVKLNTRLYTYARGSQAVRIIRRLPRACWTVLWYALGQFITFLTLESISNHLNKCLFYFKPLYAMKRENKNIIIDNACVVWSANGLLLFLLEVSTGKYNLHYIKNISFNSFVQKIKFFDTVCTMTFLQ